MHQQELFLGLLIKNSGEKNLEFLLFGNFINEIPKKFIIFFKIGRKINEVDKYKFLNLLGFHS